MIHVHTTDEQAAICAHSLALLQHSIGEESMHRTDLQVPAIIVAYNALRNGSDRFSQIRSTYAIIRKRRITTSMLSFVVDKSRLNAHTLFLILSKPGESIVDATTIKNRLLKKLVSEYMVYKQQSMTLTMPFQAALSNDRK